MLTRLAAEPPFRLLTRELVKRWGRDVRTRARWDASARPAYLLGLVTAATQAKKQGVSRLCAIEFGVAGGTGLLILEREAAAVSRQTGVAIDVIGFDAGGGLPSSTGDYRDHPDYWQLGDFPMDVAKLKARLQPSTRLILGDIRSTLAQFTRTNTAPVGFVAFDLDLYSSTAVALDVFKGPMLRQVPCYFDDIEYLIAHHDAGELLAIDEFNATHRGRRRVDPWAGVKRGRPFPDAPYLERLYVAHDLTAISATVLHRDTRRLAVV